MPPVRGEITAAVEPELADRLLFRLFGALADRTEPGERLQVSAEGTVGGARISISRPSGLKGIADVELFEAPRGEGLEEGFSLRLARGLARIAGGDLVSSRERCSYFRADRQPGHRALARRKPLSISRAGEGL